MPRTGGVYSPPAGTKGVPNTTIQSVPYNTLIDDLTADANMPRPVTAGGTGATSASGARTALGVEIGNNVQAYDAGLQSIAGLTTVANQILYTTGTDLYATTALTPLARNLLDDVDAATMRATIGADNASNLTSGTVADARLPGTMSGKTFSSNIVVGTSTYQTDGNIIFSGGMTPSGPSLHAALTGKANLSGATFTGNVYAPYFESSGVVLAQGGNMYIQSNGNRHLWFRNTAGVARGILYNEVTDNSLCLNIYNSSGAFVRTANFREADGRFYVDGFIETSGNLKVGPSTFFTDGNIWMSRYGNYLSSILDAKQDSNGRTYPRRIGGVDLNFHWDGQGGQPSWLWGGNDGTNMYVYNPSNFNVNWANSAGVANNAIGYGQWWQNVTSSRSIGTSYQNTTGRPIMVAITSYANGSLIRLQVSIDNANWMSLGCTHSGQNYYDQQTGIIPNGYYYRHINTVGGGVGIENWVELRA